MNDLLLSCDEGNVSILTLLDLSAAFDTIDHSILLESLYSYFGITGVVLKWFRSYLTNRKQAVYIGNNTSKFHTLQYGVPQGSVLGPILYTMYVMPLGNVIKSNSTSINYHMYADDTQLYDSCPLSDISNITNSIESCCQSVGNWMLNNKLKLNDDKTEVLVCATENKLKTIPITSITIGENVIKISDKAKNLGVYIDSSLSMEDQINYTVKIMNLELRKINQMKKYLPQSSLKTIVCSFILSRLDYCNSLLAGLPDNKLDKLQRVQNRAARLVLGLTYFDRTSSKDILKKLHWLPVRARIEYKIALICFKSLHSQSPSYLQELISLHSPFRQLRSQNQNLLYVPRTKLNRYGDRSFSKVGPNVWNSLPPSLRFCNSEELFKSELKTFLFNKHLM